ncbi:MAG: hypothetical protein A3K19_12490 [Lentisphaerae bacterium RIFOXYB12_FULL_65_16]|nr:MAG: hypothetical protein A3K18_12185 [Lentisphaerae bacterium RIFOXYA12_64_32]OGV88101.1 MAG: hypothetical protein A3K19_12490 [Lentisphaerae bacterium RIFOXYB12_FULL_65_16]
MSDRALTDKIRAEVLGMGMDLVGFAPVSRWEHAPYLLSPPAILPETQSVVVGAIHITDTWTEMGGEPEPQDRSPGGWMDQNSLLDRVSYRIVRALNAAGHKAIGVASSNIWRYRKYEGIPSLFAPDLSHIHAAAAAGLGEIGWSGLLITPEFGPRVRFVSIVTSADLVPTPMYDGPKLCDMCMECVKHCPTAALRKELGKPHEVKIGGKTYKYANKNMWRCAWAEHFNLDLNSETLKNADCVNEELIMKETVEKGWRGHERGVCQKWCVPPHLRTRDASFGRPEKQIAMNRINKRYPENMPTLRKMRDDVVAAAIRMGADVCAVGPVTKDIETVPGYTLRREMPGARTVISFAMSFPPELRRSGPLQGAVGTLMHHICLRIARMVEDYGYHATSYNWAHDLGEMAGLGKRGTGEFRELETPEFGNCVITGAVVTDALLDPTPVPEKADRPIAARTLTPKRLRQRLEAVADGNLVSLLGVAPVERFSKTVADLKANVNEAELGERVDDVGLPAHGPWKSKIVKDTVKIKGPKDYMPEAKSVIVFGMHTPQELVDNTGLPKSQQIGTYAFWQYQTYRELCNAAFYMAKFLSAQGHKVLAVDDMLGVGSRTATPRGRFPDHRSNAIEAVAAGLGQIGASGGLLTPEFGAQQRLMVLITDAELPADEVYKGADLCVKCGACVKKCPMHAFENTAFAVQVDGIKINVPRIERHRCDWSKRYNLCPDEGPALHGLKTNVPAPEGRRVTIEDLAAACEKKDTVGKHTPCTIEMCTRHCPAGAAK